MTDLESLGVLDSSADYVKGFDEKEQRERHRQYEEMTKSTEVYYVDHFNDRMSPSHFTSATLQIICTFKSHSHKRRYLSGHLGGVVRAIYVRDSL